MVGNSHRVVSVLCRDHGSIVYRTSVLLSMLRDIYNLTGEAVLTPVYT